MELCVDWMPNSKPTGLMKFLAVKLLCIQGTRRTCNYNTNVKPAAKIERRNEVGDKTLLSTNLVEPEGSPSYSFPPIILLRLWGQATNTTQAGAWFCNQLQKATRDPTEMIVNEGAVCAEAYDDLAPQHLKPPDHSRRSDLCECFVHNLVDRPEILVQPVQRLLGQIVHGNKMTGVINKLFLLAFPGAKPVKERLLG